MDGFDNKKFIEVEGGYYDDNGFYYTLNGSFWDDEKTYFNKNGVDSHGGRYDINFKYVPGIDWDENTQCYNDEKDQYLCDDDDYKDFVYDDELIHEIENKEQLSNRHIDPNEEGIEENCWLGNSSGGWLCKSVDVGRRAATTTTHSLFFSSKTTVVEGQPAAECGC